jgi:hypothetical protein
LSAADVSAAPVASPVRLSPPLLSSRVFTWWLLVVAGSKDNQVKQKKDVEEEKKPLIRNV